MNLNMPLGIRIKASDKPSAKLALKIVGGRVIDGPHPRFAFTSEAQRIEYDRTRRRLEEKENGPINTIGEGVIRKGKAARRGYRKRLSKINS